MRLKTISCFTNIKIMKPKIKKASGILKEMIDKITEESLEKTRQEMKKDGGIDELNKSHPPHG